MIQLRFTYTKEEWIDSRRVYLLLSKTITKLQMIPLALCAVFLIGIISFSGFTVPVTIFTVLFCGLLILYVYLYFIQPGWIYRAVKKYHYEYRLDFSEQEIRFETQGIHSILSWNNYDGFFEHNRYFFLLQGKMNYTLLPKRVFSSAEELGAFQKLLHAHLAVK